MKKYMVGGAVRDLIMGNGIPKDYDYVWTGTTEQDMLDMGMSRVGADFPVYIGFLGNENALARRERKEGVGYNGFVCEFGTDVTIEEDLYRRDLTINSIAMDEDTGEYIDPYGGVEDIKNGILRHTNPDAFKDDPLRVLRVARFLATFPEFEVHPTTFDILKEMANSGELETLTVERVWKETEKALAAKLPSRFFVFLRMIGALKTVFPEIDALCGVPQPYKYHPEGDCFIHTMMVLDEASKESGSWYSREDAKIVRFAALCHDLGKATSDPEKLPSHSGHEARGYDIVMKMAERLPIPNAYRDIAASIAKYHTHIHNFKILNSKTIVKMFDDLPTKKYGSLIISALPFVSMCDHRGRTSFFVNRKYDTSSSYKIFLWLLAYKMSDYFDMAEIEGKTGEQIKEMNYRKKINLVQKWRQKE